MSFTVTYNGNTSDGGTVPTDPHGPYNQGDTVNVQGAGSLSKTGAVFAYWNTQANGGGTIYGWPVDTSFTMPAANVVLYAQWFVTTLLTAGGATTHYHLYYDSSLQATGLEPGRTNTLLLGSPPLVEQDYALMANTWFPGVTAAGPSPIPVYVTRLTGGANNTGDIRLKPNTNDPNELRAYLISEVTESFMYGQGKGWGFVAGVNNEESCGEALSLFLTQQFELSQGIAGPYTAFPGQNWLNSSLPTGNPSSTRFYDGPTGYDYGARVDYVNQLLPWFGNGPGTGCSILFIYYLFHQLAFSSIPQIIAAAPGYTNGVLNATAPLRGVYQSLTNDAGDPFPFFARLMANAYPASQVSSIPGPLPDDPFPLGILSFWCNNTTFSRDQAQDLVATQAGVVSNAFYLILEGFSIDSFNALGVTVPTPAGLVGSSGVNLHGITIRPSPASPGGPVPAQARPIFEDPTNTKAPQRIRFSFDIVFSDESAFPTAGAAPVTATASAAAQIGGATVLGATATAAFELLGGANPYFTNLDASNAADLPYLSQDLRVFSVIAGQSPLPGAPPFTSDAYASIQSFIHFLNHNPAYTQPYTPSAPDPLNQLPGQTGYETGDSSVRPDDGAGHTAYNFAIARVRLRGTALDTASNCRVFFRLFVAQSCDTDFQPSTTYSSTHGTSGADLGHPVFPLPSATNLSDPSGQTLQTIPYFATTINGTHDYDGTPDANIRDVQIPAGQDQVWAYYGCFLDIYDAAGNANLGGTHHCIVAEIAYSLAPIPMTTATGAAPSPLSWDQLAQRNLQITLSENPKSRATHIAPQAFDLRPSRALVPLPGEPLALPDELMIDWGNTPPGSVATIYWPGLNATDVLALASSLYASHLLTAADAHTLQCTTTRGVTYIPIPHVSGVNFAGLLTIDLPPTIVHGEVFDIMVRRVSSRRGLLSPPPPPAPPVPKLEISTRKGRRDHLPSTPALRAASGIDTAPVKVSTAPVAPVPAMRAVGGRGFDWRQVCGAFQVRIPVTNAKVMLPLEEDTLAILKWRLQEKPAPYRWRPVWERYIELVAGRVKGLGGDPSKIPPSLGGYPGKGHGQPPGHEPEPHHGHGEHHGAHGATGKVDGVSYDRFGDFEGFELRTEHGHERRYRAREAEIERLVLEAWRERCVITVEEEDRRHHDHDAPPWVMRITLWRPG